MKFAFLDSVFRSNAIVRMLALVTLLPAHLFIVCNQTILAEPPVIVNGTEGKALPAPDLTEPPFTLSILPDRTTGQPWGIRYLKTAVDELNLIRPDAVFTIGDMVQGYTRVPEKYRAEAEEYLSIVKNLKAPFYPLPGNHDVISGNRDSDDHQFETLYEQSFGPLYFSAQFSNVTVISIYTDEQLESDVHFSDVQMKWIKEQIAAATDQSNNIVMLMHKPAWRYRRANWEPIHEALRAAEESKGIHAVVIAGHYHSLQRDPDRDGIEYILVGTCGALIDQHPLGGQLQHLTFLRVFPDDRTPILYHTPIGCTLPSDFVLADDQRRNFTLKSRAEVCKIDTIFDQPINRPIADNLKLSVHNPLDREITLTAELVKSPPEPSIVEGYGFVSRTPIDIFNPTVTNIDTPFEQTAEVKPITLGPNESGEMVVPVRCEAQGRMIPPPQINLTATFVDDQGRRVPVFIRRRVPLRMRYIVNETLALNMPVSAWVFSVYDHRERDPLLGLSTSSGFLNMALAVFDDIPSYRKTDDPAERLNNPESDTVVFSFGDPSDSTSAFGSSAHFLIEPLSPEHLVYRIVSSSESQSAAQRNGRGNEGKFTLEPEPSIRFEFEKREKGFGLLIHVPLELAGKPGETVPFNLRIADNDRDYHTQWRQWSPDGADSTIVLPPHF